MVEFNMYNRFYRYILFLLVFVLSFQSCEKDNSNDNDARLRVKLTDATSLTIKELYVDISQIDVYLFDTLTLEGDWLTLDYSRKTFNFLSLLNGKTVQVVDQYAPADKMLQQVRLFLGSDNRMVANTDSTYPLQIPAELQEGIVFDAMGMALRPNTISSMILDLNAAGSIWQTETDKKSYFLNPKIRAFSETYGGKLVGYVAPLLEANPYVKITQGEDTLFTYPEGESLGATTGKYQFIGLNEGEWKVHLIAHPESGFADSVFVSTVVKGETTTITPNPIRLPRITEE